MHCDAYLYSVDTNRVLPIYKELPRWDTCIAIKMTQLCKQSLFFFMLGLVLFDAIRQELIGMLRWPDSSGFSTVEILGWNLGYDP